jgi:mRNA interferase MazF
MKPGDVILTSLPQFDGRIKTRPAVVLSLVEPHRDPLVCGISTQLREEVRGLDELIIPGDTDFKGSGLKAPSLIRVAYLTVIMPQRVLGRIGTIGNARLKRMLTQLSQHIQHQASHLP